MKAHGNGHGAIQEGNTNHVAALRAALRAEFGGERENQRAVDTAAAPLIQSFGERLLQLCRRLTRGAPHAALEADDLAVLGWHKILRYLAGPGGDRVADDAHFGRLLMTAARSCLLDALEQRARQDAIELDRSLGQGASAATPADLLADTEATAEQLLLPRDSAYLKLVEELFTDEARFSRTYRQPNQRRPRNYQALVLYQIGEHWREEVGQTKITDPRRAALIRHYVALLGIPARLWASVEKAAMTPEPEPEQRSSHSAGLLAAVNAACGTNLSGQTTLKVLRHEMGRFALQGAAA